MKVQDDESTDEEIAHAVTGVIMRVYPKRKYFEDRLVLSNWPIKPSPASLGFDVPHDAKHIKSRLVCLFSIDPDFRTFTLDSLYEFGQCYGSYVYRFFTCKRETWFQKLLRHLGI